MNPTDRKIINPPARYATLADFPPQWIAQVREVIRRDGHKIRAGFPACIEVKGPTAWQPLMLPTNSIEFAGKRDRDAVIEMLRCDEPAGRAARTNARDVPTSGTNGESKP